MASTSTESGGYRVHWLSLCAGAGAILCVALVVIVAAYLGERSRKSGSSGSLQDQREDTPRTEPRRSVNDQLTGWWDPIPPQLRTRLVATGSSSNIHPRDYVGPNRCKECHPSNYAGWSRHPHRWMNALASDATVKGDFSGTASIRYLGGTATFYRKNNKYYMRLRRGAIDRVYRITQTIGSRFFQYYVGTQISGPEPLGHEYYTAEKVLPFGYWLTRREWVPIVHVQKEKPDGQRYDPFEAPKHGFRPYATSCNFCHTTFPLGDMLGRQPGLIGKHAPRRLHWELSSYVKAERPDLLPRNGPAGSFTDEEMQFVIDALFTMEAPKHAAALGITCEACHLGTREHVESGGETPPRFFAASPFLFVEKREGKIDYGRTAENVNWACGRCHNGKRPTYAAGMSTWNSVEYTDAILGGCYPELRCVDCHNPHRPTGAEWSRPPKSDDAVCIRCHDKFSNTDVVEEHTHHPIASSGARCLNCHMPRINEGLQDVVRTHMIYSPTNAAMIEANHPNACNLCHTDKTIDWTLENLKRWYGREYSPSRIAVNYPHRKEPAAIGWLKSENEAVRLVGADALLRNKSRDALPLLIDALDDPYLINRQFTERGFERWLGIRPRDFGYRFYMSPQKRKAPLEKMRRAVLHSK